MLREILGGLPGTGNVSDSMYSVAFSPYGDTLAVGDSFGLTWLLNVADPAYPTLLGLGDPKGAGTESVEDLAFSPDGRLLAVSYSGGVSELWNVVPSPGL